jgi:hypothetical protein
MSLDSTIWLILLGLGILLGVLVVRYISSLRAAADVRAERPLYQEWFASGSSQKNIFTKLGGARNCLRLVVTHRYLWVTSWPPFALLAFLYDLEHIIPLERVLSIERSRHLWQDSLDLSYTDERGYIHALRLFPKHPEPFLRALNLPPGKLR